MFTRLKTEYILYSSYAIMHRAELLTRNLGSRSNQDSLSIETPSIKALKDNAAELGITVEDLAEGAYEFKLGDKTRRVRKGPLFDVDNAFAYWLCGDKYATFETLRKYGFQQVPRYKKYSLGAIKEARQDFLQRNRAVVIKPCFGTSGGKGVTADIRSMSKLNRAIYHSLMYDGNYLMEDFIEGDNYRFLLFKDKILDAYQRIPANVRGDGKNDIKNLIRIENDRRARERKQLMLNPIVIDNDVKQSLLNKKKSLNYVPQEDEIVYVKTAVNHRAGGESRVISGTIHEDIINDCKTIMRIMDITLGGIDIITKNIEKPLAETGGAVNEVNTSPGLSNKKKEVVKRVLTLMFEQK